ncbi:type II toxin-antitoxin system VapB family antitoxin [Thermoanaerobacterium sp. RBIITD]|uniref:type II toxin-antitoxin system VapB family antitoxin n=1 Tax=Thermoanaerobacterium sp. RBIITD TaxID=1550240 RepID=UPI000BB6C786|nr:type II toxin-antitoxin system VapB family antitoxin [Thermoanaerobacterium sp. RBIITD]
MRTNIVIDDKLIEKALKITRIKTKKEIVNIALKELIENHKRKNLMDLKGKIQFDENYDYKKMRENHDNINISCSCKH